MNTNKEAYYEIVCGPSKDTLFDSCKFACVSGARIPVKFSVAIGYTAPKSDPVAAYVEMATTDFRIMGIENEDGSGYSFNLHGYCKADLSTIHGTPTYKQYRFKAYYNSKRRSGCITFIQ